MNAVSMYNAYFGADADLKQFIKAERTMDAESGNRVLAVGNMVDQTEIEALRRTGYTVEIATTLFDAVEKLATKAYSRILADLSTLIALGFPTGTNVPPTEEADLDQWLSALRETDLQCRAILESMHDGVVLIDNGGNLLDVNAATESISGVPREILLTLNTEDFPASGLDISEACCTLLREGHYHGELRISRADGSTRDVDVMGIANVRPGRHLLIVRDITESRRVADELKESEETYRNLIERSNDGVVVLQNGIIRIVNPRFCEMSGYSRETLLNTPFTNYLTPEEIATLYDRYKRRMAGEYVPSVYETVMTRKNKTKIPLEISAAIVPYQRRPADLVLVRDITERKQAEEYLQRYRLLSEHTRDVMLFAGLDGRIIEANRAAVNTHGYTREELVRMNVSELKIEEERWTLPQQFERAQRESMMFEAVHRRKDGSTFPVEVSLSAAEIQGKPVLLGVIRDITERKRAQEALDAARQRAEESLERERYFSQLLQRALLPAQPFIGENFTVAVGYVPAFAEREVGGDFYDAFMVEAGWSGVMIGDVSGKGLEAASLAATTRSTIHAFVHETCAAGEVLSRANCVIQPQQPNLESFVTVYLATIHTATGLIRYSSAGHPPMVVIRADGRIEFLQSTNPPLGAFVPINYTMGEDYLNPGDKLVLYTDGITEAHTDIELFNFEGIQRTLVGHADWTAQEVVDRLICAATEWGGGQLRDDAAVIVVHRHPL